MPHFKKGPEPTDSFHTFLRCARKPLAVLRGSVRTERVQKDFSPSYDLQFLYVGQERSEELERGVTGVPYS